MRINDNKVTTSTRKTPSSKGSWCYKIGKNYQKNICYNLAIIAEVFAKVFSVTRLSKIIKNTSAKTFFIGNGVFFFIFLTNFVTLKISITSSGL
jgi:hypothetical protein